MCGIAGIYNFQNKEKVKESALSKMCAALTHRGPDEEGVYLKDNIGLGHRRLSIIDLESGHQPMSNEDGTVWVVYNGEIYNFPQLKEELLKKGHTFRTRSDTEVIIHLYEEEKEACLDRLNGMFSFCIWDERGEKLFLARDRLGIKPLHYALLDGKIIFASEIKAILQEGSVSPDIDYEALHDYLTLMYVPSPKTILRQIRKLPAGHYLVCSGGQVRIKQYWDIDFSKVVYGSEDEICNNIYSRLKESVRLQLISDVTLGAFLSGGIDSSSVVSMMCQLQDKPVITNSIGFSDKNYDELRYARLLARIYGTDHHEYIVKPQALEVLDKLLWFYDEPFGDASSIPTYYVSKIARQNVKVALSGDGGDENFAGYTKYMYSNASVKFQRFLPVILKDAARRISCKSISEGENIWSIKLRNKLEEFYLSPFELYFKVISVFKEEEKPFLYSGIAKEKIKDYSPREYFRSIFESCKAPDYISKLQYLDIKTSLPDDMLTKIDRASMANSLEVRVPFLDHTFMEYVASIPAHLKFRGLSGKYVFKKAVSKSVPSEILYRSKMGFEVPITMWLRHELKALVEDELFDRNGIVAELFNRRYIDKIWAFVLHSRIKGFTIEDFSCRIWLLFIFSRWFKKYIRA